MAHATRKIKDKREAESTAVLRQWPPNEGGNPTEAVVLGPGAGKHLAKREGMET